MMQPNMPLTDSDRNSIHVEPVPGHADRWLAHVGPVTLPLSAESADHKPRTRDVDLAAWLEFGRPRDIRPLIKRMISEGKLRGVEVCDTVPQTVGGRPGREFWLTREQALLVATQSGTAKAWEVTEAMVQVFDAVLERRAVPTPAPADHALSAAVAQALALVPQLVAQVTALRSEVSTLRGELATGVIGEEVAETEVLRPLRRVVVLYAHGHKKPRGVRRHLENRLRAILGHVGRGSRWSMLPRRLLDVAQRQLTMWLDDAVHARANAERASQIDLFASRPN